jgi:hypothetical protein
VSDRSRRSEWCEFPPQVLTMTVDHLENAGHACKKKRKPHVHAPKSKKTALQRLNLKGKELAEIHPHPQK